ncbi:SAM hydroxide adenosyltransferase [Candidatus Methanocrinis natronophilus]|uniref:SAM-dependent chlorinase/fluorinase n=1 Tax=Candidatus Methanocrinis natronophilus TaxID=3033396 RepID=A0ABT5X4J9_9EURY|nr:SAM hydroxide adenosyltransferase [Candidatus Methanocrinis natronophilus]MDF0589613.1 SAM-dependent chlorinase/fluorinase [Candidatus Methanocrinis natronophilus]
MDPSSLGPDISDPVRIEARRGRIEDGAIVGAVTLVDHFGNIVTDIPGDLADEAGLTPEDGVEIAFDGEVIEATFGRTYADVPAGEWVLLTGHSGRLEIAINMDRAAEAVEATPGTKVQVQKI